MRLTGNVVKIWDLLLVLLCLLKPAISADDEFGEQIVFNLNQSDRNPWNGINDTIELRGLVDNTTSLSKDLKLSECTTDEKQITESLYGRLSPIHSLKWKLMIIYVPFSWFLEFGSKKRKMYAYISQAAQELDSYLAPCGVGIIAAPLVSPPDSLVDDYVEVISGDGCYSDYIGRKGGRQIISLNVDGCSNYGTVLHEILHALGFHHTHRRPDRDDYVTIFWDNIKASEKHNFEKTSASDTTTYGISYNYRSVMHYHGKTFSTNKKDTIRAKNGQEVGPDYDHPLQASDINMLVLHYCNK